MFRSKFKRIAAVAGLILTFGMVAAVPASASTPAKAMGLWECSVYAETPTYASPEVTAHARGGCYQDDPANPYPYEIRVWLLRDGATAAYTAQTMWNEGGRWAPHATNAAGDQLWCSYVELWIDGSLEDSSQVCESAAW